MERALFEKYAEFAVRVGTGVLPGQTLMITAPIEAAEFARCCAKAAFAAGARDVSVRYGDEKLARIRYEAATEEALCDAKPWVERSYLDYVEGEGGASILHILGEDPEAFLGLDAGKINRAMQAARNAQKHWREMTMKDLLRYIFRCFSLYDYVGIVLAMLAATLVGLIPPALNNLLFGDVLADGNLHVLVPLALTFLGVSVSALLFTLLAAAAAVLAGLRSRSLTLGCAVFAALAVGLSALFLWRGGWLTAAFDALLEALCLFAPFERFVNGIFSLPAVLYYLSAAALFLFFTAQGIEKRRWL